MDYFVSHGHHSGLDSANRPGKTELMDRVRTLRLAAIAALVAGSVGLTACHQTASAATAPVHANQSQPAARAPSPSVASAAPSSPAPSTTSTPSTPPTNPLPTAAKLKIGSTGAGVKQLQQQLNGLGYWVGKADGKFGGTTQQAVYALQKSAGQKPTGTVTSATWKDLAKDVKPKARSKSGKLIEVDLKRDLVMFVTNGQVKYTLNTSTGGGYVYYDQGVRNVATTPRGHFTTYRTINAAHRSSLGLLYRPRYFSGGFAIHGDSSVPAQPVSHGCVRVSDAAINWIWSQNLDPIGMRVWIY